MFWLYILTAILLFIIFVKYKHSYWKRRGVYQIEPEFLFGNSRKVISSKISLGEAALETYRKIKSAKEKHGGFYTFLEPIYVPVDVKIIKHILLTDFSNFMNHGVYHHPKDILTMNLFNMEGEDWKNLRTKLTPSFSPVKIKAMFGTLLEKESKLGAVMEKHVATGSPCNIKDILARFATDVIGSCGFGIETNSLEYPDDPFRIHGRKVFQPNPFRTFVSILMPSKIFGLLNIKLDGTETTDFFTRLVKDTVEYREKNEINRKDFLQLLIEMKNNKKGFKQNVEHSGFTMDEIIAQCYMFYLAGFETSSSTSTFVLLQLAQNLDIQEKVRQEIHEVLAKYNDEITYDAIMEMKYLDKVIDETLRILPPAPTLPRVCSNRYKVPGTDLILEKGTRIQIPVWGIHSDPDYYPNPEKFNPENFSDENKAKRPECTFMPFGEGPRLCIGFRFGKLQTKFAMVTLLKKYKFSLHEKTQLPIKMEPATLVMSVKGNVWLNVNAL